MENNSTFVKRHPIVGTICIIAIVAISWIITNPIYAGGITVCVAYAFFKGDMFKK